MARERFEDGSSQADGATYTLDNPNSYGGNLGTTIHHKDDSSGTWWDEKRSTPDREDVNRFRGIGDAMQNRPDYQFDWSQADESRRNGLQSGAYQDDASNAWKQQALGQDRTSYNYGKSLLDRGAQNQQAAALSTAGGPLAQVGAASRAANASAAYMQKGTNDLNAQQADDQAAGRAGWAKSLGDTRKMDQTGQSLSDQQAEMAAQAAAQQRRLNDAGQYGMEQNAVRVEGDAVNATQHQLATVDKIRNANDAASDAKDARAIGLVGAGISAIPVVGGAMSAGGQIAVNTDRDPNSDERVKDKTGPGELVAAHKKNPFLTMAYEAGPQKATKGYAESRRGQEGDMFGGGPSGQGAQASSWDTDHDQAAGTRDFLKYGTPSTRSEAGMDDFSKAVMTSDERAKEKAQDDEETRRFMEGSKPVAPLSKEDRDKEEYELRERAHEEEKKRADATKANRIDWVNNEDAKIEKSAATLRKIPLLGQVGKPRAGETDDQKLARAEDWHKRDADVIATKKKVNDWAGSLLPESVRGAAVRAPVAMGYRPEQDPRQKSSVRQPVSFEFGDKDDKSKEMTSDEKAKNKASGYEDTQIHSLGYEGKDGGDTTVLWDGGTKGRGHSRDVTINDDAAASSSEGSSGRARLGGNTGGKVNLADAERARAEAIRARKAAEAADRPAQSGSRKYTNDELKKMGDEMQGNVRVQSETQLGEGPSVGKSKWLDDYMTSDEKTKSRSSNPLIEMQKSANRELRGETYRYKDGFGEDTNQLHHGFMAQNLEKNPITATAVREGDDGIKKVNNEDALRVTAAGVASLQEQHDELEAAVDALASRRKKRVA